LSFYLLQTIERGDDPLETAEDFARLDPQLVEVLGGREFPAPAVIAGGAQ